MAVAAAYPDMLLIKKKLIEIELLSVELNGVFLYTATGLSQWPLL